MKSSDMLHAWVGKSGTATRQLRRNRASLALIFYPLEKAHSGREQILVTAVGYSAIPAVHDFRFPRAEAL